MNKELAKTIGTGARQARKALQLTQEDIAERIGVSVEFYARIERGTSLPSIITFARIVSALGVSADVLLGHHHRGPMQSGVWTAPPAADKPEIRRIVRRLRTAQSGTLRLVAMLLKELERVDSSQNGSKDEPGGSGANSGGSSANSGGSGAKSGDSSDSSTDKADASGSLTSDGDTNVPVDGTREQSLISSSDGLIAASSALGVEPAGMRAMSSPKRVSVYGTTSTAVGE